MFHRISLQISFGPPGWCIGTSLADLASRSLLSYVFLPVSVAITSRSLSACFISTFGCVSHSFSSSDPTLSSRLAPYQFSLSPSLPEKVPMQLLPGSIMETSTSPEVCKAIIQLVFSSFFFTKHHILPFLTNNRFVLTTITRPQQHAHPKDSRLNHASMHDNLGRDHRSSHLLLLERTKIALTNYLDKTKTYSNTSLPPPKVQPQGCRKAAYSFTFDV